MNKTEKIYCTAAGGSVAVLLAISTIHDVQISREAAFLYHIVLALSVVAAACGIALQGLVVYKDNMSRHRVLPGTVFLFVGVVSFAHVLAYPGLPLHALFSAQQIDNSQFVFWTSIIARLVQSLGLLVIWHKADMSLQRRCYFYYGASGILSIATVWFLFTHPELLPVLFIKGQGGTQLKFILEYIVLAGFGASLWVIYNDYRFERSQERLNLMLSYVFLLGGQSTGTFFTAINSLDIITAHAYRFLGFVFLLRSLYISTIVKPFDQEQAALAALKNAQRQLVASEYRFRTLVDSMDDFIATLDRNRHFTSVYGSWFRKNSVSENFYLGKCLEEVLDEPARAIYLTQLNKVYAGQVVSFDWKHTWPGGLTYFHTTLTPLESDSGGADTILIVSHDITALKNAERALLRQTNLLDILQLGTAEFIRSNHSSAVFGAILDRLLQVTGSDYAFLEGGEFEQDGNDSVFLSWECMADEVSEQRDILARSVRLHADEVLLRREAILKEKGREDEASLMGIPITSGDGFFGVFVLARMGAGYDEEELQLLRPFTTTAGILLEVICADNDRKKAEKTALEMKQVAEKAMWSKVEFVAKVSHDIRTPMSGIIGMMEIFLDTPLTEQQRKYATVVYESASSLNIILNDILALGKMEAHKIELQVVPFRLLPLLEGVTSLFGVNSRKNQTTIRLEFAKETTSFVLGDPVRLRQILINLVSNAVKFTHNGDVVVEAWLTPKNHDLVTFHCEVSDNGSGIEESTQKQLFTPFYQVSSSVEQKNEGSGLGLAICKHLVELMGGTIGVSSKAGEGSTFWFSVPMRLAMENQATEAFTQAEKLDLSMAGTVLIVEDNPVNRELVLLQLAKLNITNVHVAVDGNEAVKAVEGHGYALILMDCYMPWMDGFEATRLIRRHERTTGRHIPIVALTSHAEAHSRAKCIEAGMDDFISKPVTLSQLEEVLQRFMDYKTADTVVAVTEMKAEVKDHVGNQDLVDMDIVEDIKELSQLKGCNMLTRLVDIYASEFPRKCEEIAEAAKHKDTDAVKSLSHSLKSGSAAIGARAMVKLCATMEAQAAGGDIENVDQFLKTIKQCFANTKAVYEKIA